MTATLQTLLDNGIGLRCWCGKCSTSWVLDGPTIASVLGPDYPIPDVDEHVICLKCGKVCPEVQPDWQGPGVIVKAVP